MRDEFKINRQGKQFVLFAGLLDEAHERFTKGFDISTELIQSEPIPIVRARFEGTILWPPTGEEKVIKTSGIGTGQRKSDRSGAAADAPIEMAETRAKARALRDAVNVGATSLEELSDDAEPQQQRQRQQPRPTPEESETPLADTLQGRAQELKAATKDQEAAFQATRDQVRELSNLLKQDANIRGISHAERISQMEEHLGFELADLSRGEAEGWLQKFHKALAKAEEAS